MRLKPPKLNLRRFAFTLIELLVVIGIIGLLVGLLLPAVQAARESARRMQCGNQLRQLGLGISNYHAAYNQLPRAWWLETPPKAFNGKPWGVAILPFIEQQALYESYDHSTLAADQTSARNVALVRTPIQTYMCPSSPGSASERRYRLNTAGAGLPFTASDLAPSDYCATTGVRGLFSQHAYANAAPAASREGAMQVVSAAFGGFQDGDFAGLLDGLSHTFLLGERTGGAVVYSRYRIDPVATSALIGLEGGGWGDLLNGEHWLEGSLHGGLSWPPLGGPCAINCTNARGFGYHSFHPGGAHFLFADGAVAFFTENVEAYLFASHITRRGREIPREKN